MNFIITINYLCQPAPIYILAGGGGGFDRLMANVSMGRVDVSGEPRNCVPHITINPHILGQNNDFRYIHGTFNVTHRKRRTQQETGARG